MWQLHEPVIEHDENADGAAELFDDDDDVGGDAASLHDDHGRTKSPQGESKQEAL
jgi:hypothetical protein